MPSLPVSSCAEVLLALRADQIIFVCVCVGGLWFVFFFLEKNCLVKTGENIVHKTGRKMGFIGKKLIVPLHERRKKVCFWLGAKKKKLARGKIRSPAPCDSSEDPSPCCPSPAQYALCQWHQSQTQSTCQSRGQTEVRRQARRSGHDGAGHVSSSAYFESSSWRHCWRISEGGSPVWTYWMACRCLCPCITG